MTLKNGFKTDNNENEQKNDVEIEKKDNSQRNNYNNEDADIENDFEIPDGGWGWMVAIGLTVVYVRILYYDPWLEK